MDPVESFYEGIDPRFVTNPTKTDPKPEPSKTTGDAYVGLIVNYLPSTMTEDSLSALFTNICPIHSCRLMTDKTTGKSLSYGFVNFNTSEEAQRAITAMNGQKIENKTIRVSFAREANNEGQHANLYIQNLNPDLTEDGIKSIFDPFGEIVSHKLFCDNQGYSRSTGMVRFTCRSAAEQAIIALNGKTMEDGRQLIVKHARPHIPRAPTYMYPPIMSYYSQIPPTQAVVPNCHSYMPEYFSQQPFPQHVVPHAPPYPPPITQMSNPQSMPRAPNQRFGMMGDAVPPPPSNMSYLPPIQTNTCIYISNLSPDSTSLHLFQLFAPFGAITHVNVVPGIGKGGIPTAVGFVNFVKLDEACNAINALNRTMPGAAPGKLLNVSLKHNSYNKRT